jgi:hypothetical protein
MRAFWAAVSAVNGGSGGRVVIEHLSPGIPEFGVDTIELVT